MAEPATAAHLQLPDELSADYCDFNRVLPIELDETRVRVASSRAPANHVLKDLEKLFRRPIEFIPIDDDALDDAIRRSFASAETVVELVKDLDDIETGSEDGGVSTADVRDLATQPPVVRYVNLLIREAADSGASDIHLEAARDGLRVLFRVDGVLSEVAAPPRGLQAAVVSRLKLLAELDIAERRMPQDGRLRVRLESRELDLRVASMPSHFGESVTLRLLDHGGRPVALSDLGMAPDVLETMTTLARKRHGILLVTGPTGSGKTTTLYAALALRDRAAEKIMTVEDPVEYELPGATQVDLQNHRELTFSLALRSLLRHDPDVLMIGEIRDEDTADIAVRAAMTGHLVFSTLHTNDAAGAIPRLLDLKVPEYLAAATIEGVLAQRLVRRTCPDCRTRYRPDPQSVALLAGKPIGDAALERGAGCSACRDTGYRGRTGVFELLVFDESLKADIAHGAGTDVARLRAHAAEQGMRNLRDDAWAKVQAGITTVEEVLRVLQ